MAEKKKVEKSEEEIFNEALEIVAKGSKVKPTFQHLKVVFDRMVITTLAAKMAIDENGNLKAKLKALKPEDN